MGEEIKRIFRKHFDQLEKCAEYTQAHKTEYQYALEEITDLYADICDISYDAAASELHNAGKS